MKPEGHSRSELVTGSTNGLHTWYYLSFLNHQSHKTGKMNIENCGLNPIQREKCMKKAGSLSRWLLHLHPEHLDATASMNQQDEESNSECRNSCCHTVSELYGKGLNMFRVFLTGMANWPFPILDNDYNCNCCNLHYSIVDWLFYGNSARMERKIAINTLKRLQLGCRKTHTQNHK